MKISMGLLGVFGAVVLGEGVREVFQGKSPEYYLGTFLYAIGMLAIASMMCYWMGCPVRQERE